MITESYGIDRMPGLIGAYGVYIVVHVLGHLVLLKFPF